MTRGLVPSALALLILASVASPANPAPPSAAPGTRAPDGALRVAPGPAIRASNGASQAGSSFARLLESMRAGRAYAVDAPTGRISGSNRIDGRDHPWYAIVPESYDSARRYPVRFYLHGGVARQERPSGERWWRDPERVAGEDHIAVFPASWGESKWWQESQVDNLRAVLDDLKASYNIDENRVHAFGVSDGGTGVWYLGFRDPTPWAGFLPFIGHPSVLANPRVGAEGQLHVANLANRPWYVVNGGQDRLYPVSAVVPFIGLFQQAGVRVNFVPKPDNGHDLRWWPDEAEAIDQFLAGAVRDPLPDRLSWEIAAPGRHDRLHWLRIDVLGETATDADFEDFDRMPLRDRPGEYVIVFPRPRPAGRVDLQRDGNHVTASTRGVRAFTLLLSPDEFDLSRPVRVTVNGIERYAGLVEPDAEALTRWAARDNDRTMLFAAELQIRISE